MRSHNLLLVVLVAGCAGTQRPEPAAIDPGAKRAGHGEPEAAKDPAALVEEAVAAAGGREKLTSITDMTLRGYITLKLRAASTSRLTQYTIFPDMQRTEIGEMGREMTMVVTKDAAFQIAAGRQRDLSTVEAAAQRAQIRQGIPGWIFLALANPDANLKLGEPVEEGGKRVEVLEATIANGEPLRIYVDASTRLLKRIHVHDNDAEFDDWRNVSGIAYPFKMRFPGRRDVSMEIEEVKFNSGVSRTLFQRP